MRRVSAADSSSGVLTGPGELEPSVPMAGGVLEAQLESTAIQPERPYADHGLEVIGVEQAG